MLRPHLVDGLCDPARWLVSDAASRSDLGAGQPAAGRERTIAGGKQVHLDDIVCHERLGGVLKHYERRAA